MSSFHPINPKPFLKTLIDKQVIVRLKWNKTQYKGTLVSIDNYMNLQLDNAFESMDGSEEEQIGEIFIRCNNVLFVREAPSTSEQPATTTSTTEVVVEEVEMVEA